MRDPKRIPEIIQLLSLAWVNEPDMRLTQLVQTAASLRGFRATPHTCGCGKDEIWCSDPFHFEDDKMLEGLKTLVEQQRERMGG